MPVRVCMTGRHHGNTIRQKSQTRTAEQSYVPSTHVLPSQKGLPLREELPALARGTLRVIRSKLCESLPSLLTSQLISLNPGIDS